MLFRRVLTAALIASTAVIGTSACSMLSHKDSLREYAPSDGAQGNLGSVKARNLMILTSSKTPNSYGLIGSFVNSTSKTQTFVVSYDNQPARQFAVKAYSVLKLGYSGNSMMTVNLPTRKLTKSWAGSMVTFTLASASEPDVLPIDINIPVYDESLPGYQDLIDELSAASN